MDTSQDRPLSKSRRHHRDCHPYSILLILSLPFLALALASHHHHPSLLILQLNHCNPLLNFVFGYGLSVLIAGSACFTACCAGQFGCLALQALVLDVFIVIPLNVTLWGMYKVLRPARYLWRHLLTWFVVPYVSLFHIFPKFKEADLTKFVLAVPFAFDAVGMKDMYTAEDEKVRLDMRKVMGKFMPKITKWVPDVILTNTLFRTMLGFALFPIGWWLCDEMYCVPFTFRTLNDFTTVDGEVPTNRVVKQDSMNPPQEPSDLNVTFVFPKCKFLLEARRTFNDEDKGNKVCTRVCRLMIEEMTGKMLGHQWHVEPNLKTARCTFSITTSAFKPDVGKSVSKCCSSHLDLEW